jgi:hypothetical protein
MILDPVTYQKIFFKYMDQYADRNGLRDKAELSGGEVRDMLNDVAEEMRLLYHLTPELAGAYKWMMQVILFGASGGRKGQERKVVTLSKDVVKMDEPVKPKTTDGEE